jgi:hypothetical protein
MADDDRPVDPEQSEHLWKDAGLRGGRPASAARPLAVTEPRPVHRYGAVLGCGPIDDAADEEVLHHGAVAMQEDDGPAVAALNIVKTCSAGRDEPSLWRIGQLGPSRVAVRNCCGARQGHTCKGEQPSAPSLMGPLERLDPAHQTSLHLISSRHLLDVATPLRA